ncbi:hypothetical protein ACB098_01G077700 [Castanea mollissima]|uniref:Bromo domain-containing protein n=1 Tax=Castanea mollissima TaxID=60419 RepID=A0A8J4RVC6_9ROSI|nr:hypothetical protein CMV_002803 [Castanea mollissima]
MGEVSSGTTMTMQQQQQNNQTKKKKKGRPSLLDLQKRSLKQQQQQQRNPNSFNLSSNSRRRPSRRNPNSDSVSDDDDNNNDDDDDDERKEKKHKLLHGLNSHPQYPTLLPNSLSFTLNPYSSDLPNSNFDDNLEADIKRRKITAVNLGSDPMEEKVWKATDTIHGSQVESGPTTPLPDKKLLVFILDRLQKKDTHGVFSEPVDPEELPDYHDIIENPMDFGTVRKKLDGGAYANLEQFEKDVLLICTNAMQYNAPDTVFFRQARSMQELAKKDFENLRQESDDNEPQPKVVRRGRPPGKNLKKSLSGSPYELVCPEPSPDATLASGGGNAGSSNTYNLRKGLTPYKSPPVDALVRASHGSLNSETGTSWWSEWENEFPASVLKSVLKYGKKQFVVDENRRDTYQHSLDSGHGPSVLGTLEGELKQLMAVGLHLEHGYARSLTRFAAGLGPVVWKIASQKIERVLPTGLKFGPGWVGENEASKQQQSLFNEEKFSDGSIPDKDTSKALHHRTSSLNTVVANGFLSQGKEDFESTDIDSHCELISVNSSVGGLKSVPPFRVQQKPIITTDINGLNDGFGSDFSSQIRMVRLASLTGTSDSDYTSVHSQMPGINSSGKTTMYQMTQNGIESNEARFSEIARTDSGNLLGLGSSLKSHGTSEVPDGQASWQRLSMHHKHDSFPFPPDLNVRFRQTDSPSSSVQIGSPQQPDLALQL